MCVSGAMSFPTGPVQCVSKGCLTFTTFVGIQLESLQLSIKTNLADVDKVYSETNLEKV